MYGTGTAADLFSSVIHHWDKDIECALETQIVPH